MNASRILWRRACWTLATALLGLFLLIPSIASAKGGGGVTVQALSGATATADGTPNTLMGIGGQFVNYPTRRMRFGGEGYALAGSGGGGGQVGLFGDFVLARVANADLFIGLAGGIVGGDLVGGAVPYFRPEFGVLWNLGRVAIEAKLNGVTMGSTNPNYLASQFVGFNLGLLFGDFPVALRRRTPPPPRHSPPPPRRRGPTPHRRPLPPPPR